MAIKYENDNVSSISFNTNPVRTVSKDGTIVWEKPFTLTLNVGVGIDYVCYRYSTKEPTALSGSSETLSNGSTIYYDDEVYIYAITQVGYAGLRITSSQTITNNLMPVYGNESITLTAVVGQEWRTTFSGDNEEYIEPDGTYHEISFSNLGSIPQDAQQVRITGSLYDFDDSSQTIYNQVNFTNTTLTEGQWVQVAELQDTGGTSELLVMWNGTSISATLKGTCYYPYVHVGQITLIEAYY